MPVFKIKKNGKWIEVSGGGGEGGSIPVELQDVVTIDLDGAVEGKPQSPLQHKDGAYIYPLTTADQVILEDNNRLNFALEHLAYVSEQNQEDDITNLFADKAMTIPAFPRTKVKAVSDDNGVGLGALLEGKTDIGHTHTATEVDARPSNWMPSAAEVGAQEKHTTKSCILTIEGWSDLSQTVNVTGVTANNTVIVTPSPSSCVAYGAFGIYCSAQADGKLTFICASKPDADLTVNVLILD